MQETTQQMGFNKCLLLPSPHPHCSLLLAKTLVLLWCLWYDQKEEGSGKANEKDMGLLLLAIILRNRVPINWNLITVTMLKFPPTFCHVPIKLTLMGIFCYQQPVCMGGSSIASVALWERGKQGFERGGLTDRKPVLLGSPPSPLQEAAVFCFCSPEAQATMP